MYIYIYTRHESDEFLSSPRSSQLSRVTSHTCPTIHTCPTSHKSVHDERDSSDSSSRTVVTRRTRRVYCDSSSSSCDESQESDESQETRRVRQVTTDSSSPSSHNRLVEGLDEPHETLVTSRVRRDDDETSVTRIIGLFCRI